MSVLALVILGSAVGVDFRVGIFTWGSYHQLSASIMYTGAVISGHTWRQRMGRFQGRVIRVEFELSVIYVELSLWRICSGHTWLCLVGRSQGWRINMDFTFPIVCFVFLLWRLYSVVLLGSSAWSGLKAGSFAWGFAWPIIFFKLPLWRHI